MDWRKGFSARYYLTIVDRDTWRDIGRIEIIDGTIKRTCSDLRESADIKCKNYSDREQLVRVWMDARQEGDFVHTPLFTGLATSPDRNINGNIENNALQCYSVLKYAQDMLLDRGWYAPQDADGARIIKDLLGVSKAPIKMGEGSSTLTETIVAEDNENCLSMAEKILEAINWDLKINGYGEITIEPITYTSIAMFDTVDNDVVEPSISVNYDWYDCPNVFRAITSDGSYAVARDEDESSLLSIPNRGREVWAEETDCYPSYSETIDEYAERRLKELQRVSTKVSYSRRFYPEIEVNDVVTLNFPRQGISGNFLVDSQTITLGYNGKTSEEVYSI